MFLGGMEHIPTFHIHGLSADLIIAGEDPVATDAVGCRVMGFNPYEIYHVREAFERGLGNIDDVKVLGERIEDVTRLFKR